MRKKEKKVITLDGLEFDSNEELSFYHWLKEALEEGLVTKFVYQPRTYVLCEALPCTKKSYSWLKKPPFLKIRERVVNKVGKYVYTPDFEIWTTDDMQRCYPDLFIYDTQPIIVDVKGDWSRGANNTSGITFGPKSAWLYHTQGVFVQKVKPKELFRHTWVPNECRFTRVKKQAIKEFEKSAYLTTEQAREYRRLVNTTLQALGL